MRLASKFSGSRVEGDKRHVENGELTIGNYPVISKGQELGPDFSNRLVALLFDNSTPTHKSASCFMPGVAFRVWKGEESVDVLLCLDCFKVSWGPPSNPEQTKISFWGSIRQPDFLRLAKEALPNDPEIQKLQE